MTKKPCTHEYLAGSETGKVLMCRDCGVVHLHLQNVSMRFDVEQFTAFAIMMAEASKRMEDETNNQARGQPTLTLVH
ncbi:hypothetical protein IVG45_11360 [Methylomonas sp. LL1]|uniref:DUF6686 family protein n=1 Tax=Methylomonas sp. LL1 TaxID=2785785 RepID=UPI0018C3FF68|nr:DUF6686 family protein [Methylomonas sp. LL1]QPK61503.1 hypothetical protein IVG45_11360 [Methylomonas sp. LL1]